MTPPTTIETILDAISTALETVVCPVKPALKFVRWRGSQDIRDIPGPMRERAFLLRLGASSIPRSMSSQRISWCRAELLLRIGYNLNEPRQVDPLGVGIDLLPWTDEGVIRQTIQYGNPLLSVDNVKRLVFIAADAPAGVERQYRFDLEWAEVVKP